MLKKHAKITVALKQYSKKTLLYDVHTYESLAFAEADLAASFIVYDSFDALTAENLQSEVHEKDLQYYAAVNYVANFVFAASALSVEKAKAKMLDAMLNVVNDTM